MTASQESIQVSKINHKPRKNALWIPRRRVFAQLQLADHSELQGDLYADICRSDGSPGRVADRLNDTSEKFMPIAIEKRHILLNKMLIVSVTLSETNGEIRASWPEELPEARVSVQLSTETCLEGKICATSRSASRMLDYLNDTKDTFIALKSYGGMTWINLEYVVGLSEIVDVE